MTFEDLSDLCGLTPVFIQQIESGQCNPSLSDMTALALALECDTCDLVEGNTDVLVEATHASQKAQAELLPRRRYN